MTLTALPPPQGMSDVDFEAIEAAVTETVRGRWFLNEFARRIRSQENRATLEAITRLEALVTAGQVAVPQSVSTDPSIRLLIQRIKEIAGQIEDVSHAMRSRGIDEDLCEALDLQSRAVAGLMRTGSPSRPKLEPARPAERPVTGNSLGEVEAGPRSIEIPRPAASAPPQDPRLAVLSRLDGLPLAKKLALFS